MAATDPLGFVYDPNSDATAPVAVRRYGAHDIRITLALAAELHRQLGDILAAAEPPAPGCDHGWMWARDHGGGVIVECVHCPAEEYRGPDGSVVPVAEAGAP